MQPSNTWCARLVCIQTTLSRALRLSDVEGPGPGMAPCSIEGLGFLRDLIALPLPAMGSKFQTQFPNHRYRCHPCCTGILGAYQVGAVHITCLEPSHPECSLAATSKQVKAITQIAPGHPGCASETLQACFTCLPRAPFLVFLCGLLSGGFHPVFTVAIWVVPAASYQTAPERFLAFYTHLDASVSCVF